MAITSKPKPKAAEPTVADNDAAEAFISGAPDAPKAQSARREAKKLISLKIAPTLLERVDQRVADINAVAERIALLGVFIRKRQAVFAESEVDDAGLFDAVERRAGEAVRRAHEQETKHQDRARKRT